MAANPAHRNSPERPDFGFLAGHYGYRVYSFSRKGTLQGEKVALDVLHLYESTAERVDLRLDVFPADGFMH